jgi:DNA topoisomerase-1
MGSRRRLKMSPHKAATAAGLRYVRDDAPGLRREGSPKAFRYVDPQGREVRDEATLARIRSLAIPPAWTDVWICPEPTGHIQAVGRDVKGRKQYRYHPHWREVRDEAKYSRMVAFGRALPGIRAATERDLRRPGLPREKVLAAVLRLLERTLIRVGNEEYVRQNRSFGLTTLRDHHVDVSGHNLRFRFRGKSGKVHEISFQDRRLSGIVKRCQDLPGQELFQYVDADGVRRTVDSGDVNAYLRQVSGRDFTAKDFRTWAGTVRAACALAACEPCQSASRARKTVTSAVEEVARRLGNTVAVCRKCYIHPAVVEAWLEGGLPRSLGRRPATPARVLRMTAAARQSASLVPGLRPQERQVLTLLSRRARKGPTPDLTTLLKRSLESLKKRPA